MKKFSQVLSLMAVGLVGSMLTGCYEENKQVIVVHAPVAASAATPAAPTAPDTVAAPVVEPDSVPTPAPTLQPDSVKVLAPDAHYEAGMAAYNEGNGLEAIKAFNRSVYPDSYYMLGMIYEQGCGTVGKNLMLARKNFKKAAELGCEAAKAKL
jgi:hypothetical protein